MANIITELHLEMSSNWYVQKKLNSVGRVGENTVTKLIIEPTEILNNVTYEIEIMSADGSKNVAELTIEGSELYLILTANMLTTSGITKMQVRGLFTDGSIKKSNIFELKVNRSISATDYYEEYSVTIFDQLVAECRDITEGAESYAVRAETAATNAEAYSESASASADAASTSATTASTASTTATTAAETATAASTSAHTSAENATTAAASASTAATSASTSATNAANSATAAATSASNAAVSATNASTSETNASTSAAEAEASAESIAASVSQINENTYRINDLEAIIAGYQQADLPTGAVASITDGTALLMPSLKVGIEPVQSGSGDPSPDNIRPIEGWTAANVTRSRKNLYKGYDVTPNSFRGLSFTTQDGKLNVQGTYNQALPDCSFPIFSNSINPGFANYQNYIDLTANNTKPIKAGNYTLTVKSAKRTIVGLYVANELGYSIKSGINLDKFDYYETLDISANHIQTFELSRGGYLGIFIRFTDLNINDVIDETIEIQLELGSTATTYEPYNGQTYTIEFRDGDNPLTVYGGTLDVTSGELTVTDAHIASYNGETLPSTWISDRDVYAEGTTPTTGAEVVYKLANSVTYQLTPAQVRTLVGTNNIWADTGDIISGKYYKSLT